MQMEVVVERKYVVDALFGDVYVVVENRGSENGEKGTE